MSQPSDWLNYLKRMRPWSNQYCLFERRSGLIEPVTFNTHHTFGTVINVNGTYALQGNPTIGQINYFISTSSLERGHVLEHLRGTHMDAEAHPSARGPSTAQTAATYVTIDTTEAPTSARDPSIEIHVIAEMMDILLDNPSLRHSETLPETLASLRRMLTLTELAIRAYQQTPLAQTLNRAIIAEAERCRQLLKDLFNNLSDYRRVLPAVLFHFIRQYVWSTAREGGTVGDLNLKLRECHSSFAACILALGRGQGETDVVLADFYSLFEQEAASLRHIPLDAVIVIDHLGRNLPMPTMFCNSWQDFHVVIAGYCKSVAGDALVQRGDYRILNRDDSQVITPAELSTVIHPGMTVEMIIVLRQQTQEDAGPGNKFPRCSHINKKVSAASGWLMIIYSQRCCGIFRHEMYPFPLEINIPSGDAIPEETCFFRRICIVLMEPTTLDEILSPTAADFSDCISRSWPKVATQSSCNIEQLCPKILSQKRRNHMGHKAIWVRTTVAGIGIQCVASFTAIFYVAEALVVLNELFGQAVSLYVADAKDEAARIALSNHLAIHGLSL
ncbi:hypothetical protein FIBSPDRAFT_938930 [Athelia psychrophila]|uniref:Ubiquitin-like domain-containing protein n=1 Tax=Athelia psychrophila TaxID=1759441 RepID=A0A165XJD1_9AGAM|nr:hypothetical protein FIBSPDRAFT_938930 [Fibularhizoctonia sp. CBS 109695]